MVATYFKIFLFVLLSCSAWSQEVYLPEQSADGPGGCDYSYRTWSVIDRYENTDGCYVFLPQGAIEPDAKYKSIVLFIHGYGGLNPMIYGAWIDHLLKQGHIVIYPRYQRNLLFPRTPSFVSNTASGVQLGRHLLDSLNIPPLPVHIIGHSYGGAIAAAFGAQPSLLDIPIASMMLCQPGTGPFVGARLDSYETIPQDIKLLVIVGADDRTVGDKLGNKVFETATATPDRNVIIHHPDTVGVAPLTAMHREPYSLDLTFDNGIRNYTVRHAWRYAETNALDFSGYWKLADAMMSCATIGEECETAFGNTSKQRSLGFYSDTRRVKELEVKVPTNTTVKVLAEKQ